MRFELDLTDKRLLNELQLHFPLIPQPFRELGKRLDVSERLVLSKIEFLQRQRFIRYIGGIFDSLALGYHSTLVAMSIPAPRLDEAAAVINQHPGVSHNYARNHSYNLWFTLTLPQGEEPSAVVNQLSEKVASAATLSLPALKVFKIGVYFDMLNSTQQITPLDSSGRQKTKAISNLVIEPLSPLEIKAIRELQRSLPLQEHPFEPMAQHLKMTENELLNLSHDLLDRGVMRRYAAVLNHRRLGFTANAMVCWTVPASQIEELGYALANITAVSHCYERPTYPDWPYNLFTMIHARSHEECRNIIDRISVETGIKDYAILYSLKEYKKERVLYFEDI